jgi:Cys-tRNA(Pro)/Cys-tRNA(Cys) deacylase
MKKKFPTFVESAVLAEPVVAVSAGVRGCQMLLAPTDLVAFTRRSCVRSAAEMTRES